jgi:hypothetical protein
VVVVRRERIVVRVIGRSGRRRMCRAVAAPAEQGIVDGGIVTVVLDMYRSTDEVTEWTVGAVVAAV